MFEFDLVVWLFSVCMLNLVCLICVGFGVLMFDLIVWLNLFACWLFV